MELWEILNRLTNLVPHGYYDVSKDMVVVHFFSDGGNKSDVMAYLKRDMTWDVREVASEKSTLLWDRESIEILHNPIAICEKGGKFDKTLRDLLFKIEAQNTTDKRPFRERNKLFQILEDNKYDD